MVKEPDSQASYLGSNPGQVSDFFVNLILLNSKIPVIDIRGFIMWKQKFELRNVTPVSIQPLDLWLQVQHSPFCTNLSSAT